MEVGPIVSRKAQFVPAFFSALNGGFTCHKQPNSTISNSEGSIQSNMYMNRYVQILYVSIYIHIYI